MAADTTIASSPKITLSILYPRHETSTFDMKYYLGHHIPTRKAAWNKYGLSRCTISEVEEDSSAGYMVIVVMEWTDVEGWKKVQDDEATGEIMRDIANFTNVKPVMVPGTVMG